MNNWDKGVLTRKIIKKLKDKDFTINYKDAIDLKEVMNVDYVWLYHVIGYNQLQFIKIYDYGGVIMTVREEEK